MPNVMTDYPETAELLLEAVHSPTVPKEVILDVFLSQVFQPCILRQDVPFLRQFCQSAGSYFTPYLTLANALQDLITGKRTDLDIETTAELLEGFQDDPRGQELTTELLKTLVIHYSPL